MSLDREKEALMVRYLFGELSEPDNTRVEESIFASDDHFAELLAVEDRLISSYLDGALTPLEKEKFEKAFSASPQRSERVEMAKVLFKTIDRETPASNVHSAEALRPARRFIGFPIPGSAAHWVFAIAAVAIVVVTFWLIYFELAGMNQTVGRLEAERRTLQQQTDESEWQINKERDRSQQLERQLEEERNRRSQSDDQIIGLERENELLRQSVPSSGQPAVSIVTFLLTPGLTRDIGGRKTLKISGSTRTVIMKLELKNEEYQLFQAKLQTPEGKEVWVGNDLKKRHTSNGALLAFPVPAKSIPTGDYILTLTAKGSSGQWERIDQFAFEVVNK